MNNTNANRLSKQNLLFTDSQQQKLHESLKLLDGISRLTLETDSDRAQEIKNIFGEAKKREK